MENEEIIPLDSSRQFTALVCVHQTATNPTTSKIKKAQSHSQISFLSTTIVSIQTNGDHGAKLAYHSIYNIAMVYLAPIMDTVASLEL